MNCVILYVGSSTHQQEVIRDLRYLQHKTVMLSVCCYLTDDVTCMSQQQMSR